MRAKQKFKKGTFSRRVFSVLMALAMVISLMPMNAMEVKAENATEKITSMTLDVDWSKIPPLTVGKPAWKLSVDAVTASGTGVSGIKEIAWAVKADQSHVDSDYINEGIYDEWATYDHWVPLGWYNVVPHIK